MAFPVRGNMLEEPGLLLKSRASDSEPQGRTTKVLLRHFFTRNFSNIMHTFEATTEYKYY